VIQAQSGLPNATFLVAHETAHVAAAAACSLWLVPAWGFRALGASVAAGTLIDIDHAIAAGSIDPARMMALGARPPTHSLAGVSLIAVVVMAVFGWRPGYAAFAGGISHIIMDASAAPGVPLFAPWSTDTHVTVPTGTMVPTLVVLGLFGVILQRLALRSKRQKKHAKTTVFQRPSAIHRG